MGGTGGLGGAGGAGGIPAPACEVEGQVDPALDVRVESIRTLDQCGPGERLTIELTVCAEAESLATVCVPFVFVVSDNPVITIIDSALTGFQSEVVVAAGGCETVVLEARTPAPDDLGGEMWLGVIADKEDRLSEANEGNNIKGIQDSCWP